MGILNFLFGPAPKSPEYMEAWNYLERKYKEQVDVICVPILRERQLNSEDNLRVAVLRYDFDCIEDKLFRGGRVPSFSEIDSEVNAYVKGMVK
jgi:hypothetical protein